MTKEKAPRTYEYVLNADNTFRRLLIHRDKKTPSALVLDNKELEYIKKLSEQVRLDKKKSKPKEPTKCLPKGMKEFPIYEREVDEKKKPEIFYNGQIGNFVSRLDKNYIEQLDKQVERKSAFAKAMKNEDRRFEEMLEKESESYFANLKCIAEATRRENKRNQEHLINKIKENDIKREEEIAKHKIVPVEKYVLARKNSAQRLEKEFSKCMKEKLEIQRIEHDLIAYNCAQNELKKYDEKEKKKLCEITEYIDDKPKEKNVNKESLQCLIEMRRLEAQIRLAKEKLLAEEKWKQFEEIHCKNKTVPEVNRDVLKTLTAKEQSILERKIREKWLEKQISSENKANDYYHEMRNNINYKADCKARDANLKSLCADIRYRKSLEKQMKEGENYKKKHKNEIDNGQRLSAPKLFSDIKPEDLTQKV